MSNNLVAYSRAGDVFHYRWAARRSLELIRSNAFLQKIVIEGSSEKKKAGEYVIDVTEYSGTPNCNKQICYYQLKHTTVQKDKPFMLSDLQDTFAGFAKRFIQHKRENNSNAVSVSFSIITNRKIADTFKQNIVAISKKEKVDIKFKNTIEKYTVLTSEDLVAFCSSIRFEDSEGDYNVQKDELRIELSQLIAGSIDNPQINNLISLIQEKALPDSNGEILQEDVLKRFGITSERMLYPAPAVWEQLENIIERQKQEELIADINKSQFPVIIHAAGGVGKSVFCRQFVNLLPDESVGVSYDCFGAGSYRNRSEFRHRHRDALVQIANELSSQGFCNPLIVQNTTSDEDIMRRFLFLIKTAVESLKKVSPSAQLFILIDAADNAEMAAKEFNQSCFAHELLREKMPDGCKLLLLCRTERISLLQPPSYVLNLELNGFTVNETTENLRKYFSNATDNDGIEFHRLTGGNPRVQANALDVRYRTVNELLHSLGPSGASVEKQIELQLNSAVNRIRDLLPDEFRNNVNSICLGLASLPPHIPIDVLAKAANVKVEAIKSFVSDIGRSLWLSDASVQFRDEPTETWFRNQFLARTKDYETYIEFLEPIALQSSYVAEVLPQLYLQAEQYEKLIDIALSDDYLPEDNPIDARNIRVQRLQFAFKAALKANHLKDAVKLAMRAGEEMAGNQRQLDLLLNNIDLLSLLQSKEKVQEIAFKRLLGSNWDGSENIYAASLLSGIKEFKGEARGYLRSSMNWLNLYFEEQRRTNKRRHKNDDGITDKDILELAYSHLNIFDVEQCFTFLLRLKPKEAIFRVMQELTRRLIDLGRFDEIESLLHNSVREPYYVVAITSELLTIGRIPEKTNIEICLDLLCSSKDRIKNQSYSHNDQITPAILSFLEACLYQSLSPHKILRVLRYYVPPKASRLVSESYFSHERNIYLKALAIRMTLSGKTETEIEIDKIIPKEFTTKEKKYESNNEISNFKEVISGLLPWFLLRANILYRKEICTLNLVKQASDASHKARNNRYRSNDTLPYEVTEICSSILVLSDFTTQKDAYDFYHNFLHESKAFRLQNKLELLHAVYRIPHLSDIRQKLELDCYECIRSLHNEQPDEIASQYISMSRAVCIESVDDARAYFDEAVNIISKFGDEIVQRWDAVVSLAEQASEAGEISSELAYRFIRCAELVGEYVDREKHWNRSEAIQVCTRISSGIGISTFSRWRDRHIGRFEYQLERLLFELINSNKVTPAVGWALTYFFSQHQYNNILSICLKKESLQEKKQTLLNDAVCLLQTEGTREDYWKELKNIASDHRLNNHQLDLIVNSFDNTGNEPSKAPSDYSNIGSAQANWEKIFNGISIGTHEGFEELMRRFKVLQAEDEFSWNERSFQKEILDRLDKTSVGDFIEIILQSIYVDYYDVLFFFSKLPKEWTDKISFKKQWPKIVFRIGQRYANNLTNEYSFDCFKEELNLDQNLLTELKSGILSGLGNSDLNNAGSLFGFVKLVAPSLKVIDSIDLIDYSLSRFELHIEDDFGDGVWDDWLEVSNDIHKNIAGFIWSALGSPRSVERWNAAHCIRKLAEFNCTDVLDALIGWSIYDKVGAFGCRKFPFYNLHARQYLLIALARISLEQPELLHKHSEVFLKYTLSEPHILIQKYASEVAINVEKEFPGTYTEEVFALISNVGKTAFEIEEKEYGYRKNSYWHSIGEVDINIDFYFGWDFEQYWYGPLGSIFGVPNNQIKDLAANVIVHEWGVTNSNGYNNDPRVSLWNRHSDDRETWHDHGDYPRTDNLDFYLSYHAMLVVAAKLINKMPVIKTRGWCEDEWAEWLSIHILTPKNGKWLSDVRDPLPLKRPKWITEEKNDGWKTDINEENFIDCLKVNDTKELWINIAGGWHEKNNERTETYSISSALVAKETSNSLLRALDTCFDPYDYKLPYYKEDRMEIEDGMFVLKGWIDEHSNSLRLDKADPYTNDIAYPPYSLGEDIIKHLELTSSNDGRQWYINDSNEVSLICETWSSYKQDKDEEPDQSGIKLKASLNFLKQVCKIFNCDIILDIGINRKIQYKYDRENREYTKPQHKIFILSADGRLKTTGSDYQLG